LPSQHHPTTAPAETTTSPRREPDLRPLLFPCLANLWATLTKPWSTLTRQRETSPPARSSRAAAPLGQCVEHLPPRPNPSKVYLRTPAHTSVCLQGITRIPCAWPIRSFGARLPTRALAANVSPGSCARLVPRTPHRCLLCFEPQQIQPGSFVTAGLYMV
jgi:hypothetical protein